MSIGMGRALWLTINPAEPVSSYVRHLCIAQLVRVVTLYLFFPFGLKRVAVVASPICCFFVSGLSNTILSCA